VGLGLGFMGLPGTRVVDGNCQYTEGNLKLCASDDGCVAGRNSALGLGLDARHHLTLVKL
jgi:hypothetical protein